MSRTTHLSKPKRSHIFWMKLVLIITVLIFIGMITANMMKSRGIANYIANLPEHISPVSAMEIKPEIWTPIIETTGLIRPNQGAMLSAQVSGTVTKVLVISGQTVKKGDILVELDNAVEIANLEVARAKLPSIKNTYQRYQALYHSKSVSRQELDNAKAAFDALTANIDALEATVKRRQIVAPFDGTAGIVKVNVGQYVTMGTEIVRIEDRSQMKTDFAIAQNLLHLLHLDQNVIAIADARKGEKFSAKITAIEPAINAATGLVDLQATFEGENVSHLLSGMYVRLRILLPEEENQIVVPQVAVSYNMYGETAYILTALSQEEKDTLLDNAHFSHKENIDKVYRVKQVTVFTVDRHGIYAHLKADGIKFGDLVVTGGHQNLNNGSLVIVTDKEGVGTTPPTHKTNL